MRSSKKIILPILGITLLVLILYIYVFPVVTQVNSDMKAYRTHVASAYDYEQFTTPLPPTVVEDICLKLRITGSSEQCQANAVVYAPEFFDEIKTYFYDLPKKERTKDVVQNKLGTYLVSCENQDADGYYRCRYDLRGDKMYPIFFLFDKDDFYYEIIAHVGGS